MVVPDSEGEFEAREQRQADAHDGHKAVSGMFAQFETNECVSIEPLDFVQVAVDNMELDIPVRLVRACCDTVAKRLYQLATRHPHGMIPVSESGSIAAESETLSPLDHLLRQEARDPAGRSSTRQPTRACSPPSSTRTAFRPVQTSQPLLQQLARCLVMQNTLTPCSDRVVRQRSSRSQHRDSHAEVTRPDWGRGLHWSCCGAGSSC